MSRLRTRFTAYGSAVLLMLGTLSVTSAGHGVGSSGSQGPGPLRTRHGDQSGPPGIPVASGD
jgi:hypothetical protein